MNFRLLQFGVSLSALLIIDSTTFGYAQSADMPVHQWMAVQGQLFFNSQFGPSELDSFVGTATTYAGGSDNRIAEGAYDEDESGGNPYGQSEPSTRHFWAHNGSFQRTHDDGIQAFDSAASRAIQYFNGGNNILNVYQGTSTNCTIGSGWGCAQSSVQNQGIVWNYQNDIGDNARQGRAYYWLGNAAHLLQDLSLPAHSHADSHLELGGSSSDPDPVHDWVDGRPFRIDGDTTMGARGAAVFDDATAMRWQQWAFHDSLHGIGRMNGTTPIDTDPIRSPAAFLALQAGLPTEQANSIPARPGGAAAQAIYDQALPLYILELMLAGRADDFDSDDVNGQIDTGARRNAMGDGDMNQYNNWTQWELNQVADVAATGGIRATAELFRYFYSLVDTTPPDVQVPGLSPNQGSPTTFGMGVFPLQATASDPTSGYDLDGFRFIVERFDGTDWITQLITTPTTPTIPFGASIEGLYRLSATVENGGGHLGTSAFGYFQVVPEPGSMALISALFAFAAWVRSPHGEAGRLTQFIQ